MPKNYLIGIGGTGARVIEAVTHCCAAGFGPDQLRVFLVDPDEGNGNLTRTKALLATYRSSRQALTERNSPQVRIFHTDLSAPDPLVWGIFSEQNRTLADFLNEKTLAQTQPATADLMSILFSRQEMDTKLNEGFRGHPSIGATVMSNPDNTVNPWKWFWDDVRVAQGLHDVRVFLVGSIFGGTGAAGVPTFGAPEMLKYNSHATINAAAEESKIFLGGALVLPYFSFDLAAADRAAETGEMFVTPADFPIATRAALQYYNEKKLAFDELYLLGDSLGQKVGKFSPGSRSQENRPHYIELAATLAAFDFFAGASAVTTREKHYYIAARDTDVVDWEALPVHRDPEQIQRTQTDVKLGLTAMTAFSYALCSYGAAIFATPHQAIDDAWYRSNFRFNPKKSEDAVHDPRQVENKAKIDSLDKYGRAFLKWLCGIDDETDTVRLVDRRKLIAEENGDEIRLFDPRQHPENIATFLKGQSGQPGFAFKNFRNELDRLSLKKGVMWPTDKIVNLFYEAALRFCQANYRINPANPTR